MKNPDSIKLNRPIIPEKFPEWEGDLDVSKNSDQSPDKWQKFSQDKEASEKVEAIRKRLVDILEQGGFLKRQDDFIVANLEQFQNIKLGKMTLGYVGNERIGGGHLDIYNLLKDLRVVSKDDYDNNPKEEIRSKFLFDTPDNLDEALAQKSEGETRRAYLKPWQIGKNVEWDKEISARNGEAIMLNEYYIADKFNQMGIKRIDEKLMVWDLKANEYVPITYFWFVQNIGSFKVQNIGIHRYLKEFCPNLLERGILKLDDFRIQTGKEGGRILRKEYSLSQLGDKVEIPIDSVKYYIGRGKRMEFMGERFSRENIKIVVLDSATAGVVLVHEGRETLKYTIDLLSSDEKQAMRQGLQARSEKNLSQSQITARMFVGKGEVERRTRKFSLAETVRKRSDEAQEEYMDRVSHVADYGYVKRVTEKFLTDCDLGIHSQLSWKEQIWLASAVYDLGIRGKYDELVQFSQKYGASGLKAFMSCESDIQNSQRILELGKNLRPDQAGLIFEKLDSLVDMAEAKNGELMEALFKENRQYDLAGVRLELLAKAHNLIRQFSDEVGKGKTDEIEIAKLLVKLENSRKEIDLLSSLLIASKKEGRFENLERIRGLKLDVMDRQVLDQMPDIEKRMLEMYASNHADKSSEDRRALLDEYNKHKLFKPKYYLMFFDENNSDDPREIPDNLAGFIRSSDFDGEKELPEWVRYLGSLNLNPLFFRSYLGENFLKNVIQTEFKDGAGELIAHVAENGPSHKAAKVLGFEDIEYEGEFKNNEGNVIASLVRIKLSRKNWENQNK